MQVYVRKRPYLDRFLAWIAGRFEVTIFTASQQVRSPPATRIWRSHLTLAAAVSSA